jgi:uncharacterized phiE125 gp8 family phage protein
VVNGFTIDTTYRQRTPVVNVLVPPERFVFLYQVKEHLRVEHDEHDERIEALLDAALGSIEGPRGWLGRCFGPQTLELSVYDCSRSVFDLPYPPIIEVEAVTYDDADNTEQTIDAGDYVLRRSALSLSSSLPTYNELRVRYRAGFEGIGADSPPIDEPKELKIARAAVMLMVDDLYHGRSNNAQAVRSLLDPLRIYPVA